MHVKRDNRLLPCLMLQICLSNMTPCLVCRDAIDHPVMGCVVVGGRVYKQESDWRVNERGPLPCDE